MSIKDEKGSISSDNPEKTAKTLNFNSDIAGYFEREAKANNLSVEQYIEEMLTFPHAIVEFEETTGKAKLHKWSPDPSEYAAGKPDDPVQLLAAYRKLRKEFAPVSAGVNYHKRFMIGGGLTVYIEEPLDNHQSTMKKLIEQFNYNIYHDYYTKGLRKILNIMVDEALTVGCSGSEICYDNDDDFTFLGYTKEDTKLPPFVEREMELVNTKTEKKVKIYITRDLGADDWSALGGINRLKFLEDAVCRIQPFREQDSAELRYWILDRGQQVLTDNLTGATKKPPPSDNETYMHPWQVFWIVFNQRGLNMHGESIIKPVYRLAILADQIMKALGKGYDRWANRRYFFVTGTEKRPWGKVHVRNFVKTLELMIKNNWTGIPVPAGFDVKEIGGEVFDATDFIDYLTTLICTGMNYPKEFLLQTSQSGEDKESWIAWQNTYGFNQEQLSEDIERQLWEKQIWCHEGQTYGIPKQGTKEEDREQAPVYIPSVQWRTKMKWDVQQRLEMDSRILNVANPVSGHMKLAAEKDMADTMGYEDVVFPTPAEYEKRLKKREQVEKLEIQRDLLKLEVERLKWEYFTKHPDAIKELALPSEEKEKDEGTPTKEEQLQRRKAGGVSRSTRSEEEPNKRGEAKPQGGTRKPKT